MTIALVNARIFKGNGEIFERSAIIIKDNRIAKIDHNYSQDSYKDMMRIDLENCTVFPGFIDCHTHICLDGSPDSSSVCSKESRYRTILKGSNFIKDTLLSGITTIRDLGGIDGIDIELRDAVNIGLIPGPDIIASGRLICMTGGHGWQIGGREADGEDEVRKAVREEIKKGADTLKFMATGGVITPGVDPGSVQLSFHELKAGIEEAKKANKKTAAHAQSEAGIFNALKAGIDTIEHGFSLNEECIILMKKNNIALIPTLKAVIDLYDNAMKGLLPEFIKTKIKAIKPKVIKNLKTAIKEGILIGMGTDAGIPFNKHGDNLLEIIYLHKYGLSIKEAFQCATLNAAEILGLDHLKGSIEEGKLADIIVFKGNPLKDINILSEKDALNLIIKNGKIIKNSFN